MSKLSMVVIAAAAFCFMSMASCEVWVYGDSVYTIEQTINKAEAFHFKATAQRITSQTALREFEARWRNGSDYGWVFRPDGVLVHYIKGGGKTEFTKSQKTRTLGVWGDLSQKITCRRYVN